MQQRNFIFQRHSIKLLIRCFLNLYILLISEMYISRTHQNASLKEGTFSVTRDYIEEVLHLIEYSHCRERGRGSELKYF